MSTSKLDQAFLKEAYSEIFKLKNNDFFGLLDVDFYLEEFLFFPKITAFLTAYDHLEEERAKELGLISTLVYLSGKIHYTIDDTKTEKFAYTVQFPILLGDLLYGKVIETLTKSKANDCLADYLRYLQRLNAATVDRLNDQLNSGQLEEMRIAELAVLTAEFAGVNDPAQRALMHRLAVQFDLSLQTGRATLGVSADEPFYAVLEEIFANEFIKGEPIASLEDLCRRIDE